MTLRRVAPAADLELDTDAPGARSTIDDLYRPPSADWLRLNLIGTISGNAVGDDGTSESIANPVDRIILNSIRAQADVVLVGAASVRAEGYFVPRRADLAVLSASGDLSGHRVTTGGDRGSLVVVCPPLAVERARSTVGDPAVRILAVEPVAATGRIALDDVVAALRASGYRSVVCEGGPSLATQLLETGLVDELCLTTSPVINGGGTPLLTGVTGAPIPLELTQLLLDDAGFGYARWRIRRA